jgi:hypothetical protein
VLPQVETPVAHYFSDGVYIREIRIPADTIVIGHHHNYSGMNVAIKGSGLLYVDGAAQYVSAPAVIHAKPGAKMIRTFSEVIWWNIFPNPDNERDIDTLERRLVTKHQDFLGHQDSLLKLQSDRRIPDVANYAGIPGIDSIIRALEMLQLVDSPEVVCIEKSAIEGLGVFASAPYAEGDIIGTYISTHGKTKLAAHVNHAKQPNCRLEQTSDGCILVADRPINGKIGGMHGEELTLNYSTIRKYIEATK